jgi:hypothetical protein
VKNQVLRKSLIVSNQYTRRAYDKGRAAALAGLDETTELVKWGNRNYAADWFDDDSTDAWQAGFSDSAAPRYAPPSFDEDTLDVLQRSYIVTWVEDNSGQFSALAYADRLAFHLASIHANGHYVWSVALWDARS